MQEVAGQIFTPEDIFDRVTLILANAQQSTLSNRRLEQRESVIKPILVQRLTDNKIPIGQMIRGTSRNLSLGGLGFTCVEGFAENFVLVKFQQDEDSQMPVPIRICYRQFVGPCFEVGGEFDLPW